MNVPRPLDTSKLTLLEAESLLREAKRVAREVNVKLAKIEDLSHTPLTANGATLLIGLLNMNRERIALLETHIKEQKELIRCQRNRT